MGKLGKRKATDRKVLIKSPAKNRKKGEEDQEDKKDEEENNDPAKDPALDQINQDITEKNIDPFLLRIDKLDKLELAPVEEQQDGEESPDKEAEEKAVVET